MEYIGAYPLLRGFNHNRLLYLLTLVLATAVAIFSCGKNQQSGTLRAFSGSTMGTTYSVKYVTSEAPPAQIEENIAQLLEQVNRQMSTYLDSSEISRFNRHNGTDYFNVSADLALVVDRALTVSRQSEGAFDITVGPLVNLWGFGPERRPDAVPAEADIQQQMKRVGYTHLTVRRKPPALQKDLSLLYCDLSAIAKGFAVDKLGRYLENNGITNYLVEIGGELKAHGRNESGQPWRIGVATPDLTLGIQKVIQLNNLSTATSGDYRNYFEVEGVRYSHTIDPRTGRPISHKLASVTVLHDSCIVADAYATAIDVLGPDAGYQFAVRLELPVFMLVRDGDGFIEIMTPQFKKLLKIN